MSLQYLNNYIHHPADDITIAAIIKKSAKVISAPSPRALPVLALPICEVLFLTALPPVIMAAIPAGTDNRKTNGTTKPNKRKPHEKIPNRRDVEASLSAFTR